MRAFCALSALAAAVAAAAPAAAATHTVYDYPAFRATTPPPPLPGQDTNDPVRMETIHGENRNETARVMAEEANEGNLDYWIGGLRELKEPIRRMNESIQFSLTDAQWDRDRMIKEVQDRGSPDKLVGALILGLKAAGERAKAMGEAGDWSRERMERVAEAQEYFDLAGRAQSAADIAKADSMAKKGWEIYKTTLGEVSDYGKSIADATGNARLMKKVKVAQFAGATITAFEAWMNVYEQCRIIHRIDNVADREKALLDLQKALHKNEMVRLVEVIKKVEELERRIRAGEKITAEEIRALIPGDMLDDLLRLHEERVHEERPRMLVVGPAPEEGPVPPTVEYGAPPGGSGYLTALQMRRLPPHGGGARRMAGRRFALPTGRAAASRYGARRLSRAPRYERPEDERTTLQRMHDRERAAQTAAGSPITGGGRSVGGTGIQTSRPCPTCGGRGHIEMGARTSAQLQSARNTIRQQEAILRTIRTDTPAGAAAKRRALQLIAQARRILNSVPQKTPCPTCGGRGTISR